MIGIRVFMWGFEIWWDPMHVGRNGYCQPRKTLFALGRTVRATYCFAAGLHIYVKGFTRDEGPAGEEATNAA